MYHDLFYVGALWQHKTTGLLIRITSVLEPGKYTIGFANGSPKDETFVPADSIAHYLVSGVWTAEILVRDFEACSLESDRWDQILENSEDLD